MLLKWIEDELPYIRDGARQRYVEGFRLAGLASVASNSFAALSGEIQSKQNAICFLSSRSRPNSLASAFSSEADPHSAHARESGHPVLGQKNWVPAFAGTSGKIELPRSNRKML
jgi:hypothetical protein